MTNTKSPDVTTYYEKTRWDYRYVWGVRDTYAIHFGYYDENATHHKAAVANMNRVLANLAAIGPGDRVLDAGCGVGGSGIWLAENCRCSVVGITPVAGQIRDARRHVQSRQLADRVAFVQSDYCQTPFEDASFDVIWALESLCHARQKISFYKEAFRLLKPGGRLVIAEYVRKNRELAPEDEAILREWLVNWAIPDIDTVFEHRQHAEMAGFQTLAFQDVTKNTMRSLQNIREHCDRWHWAARLLNRIGIVSEVQLGNVLGTIRQFDALEKGLWEYGLMHARK